MMNLQTTTRRDSRRAFARRCGGAVTAFWALTAALSFTVALGVSGCQNRAGMPCQQPSDCTPGLLCNKPPAAGAQGYGICEPGLKGVGERCVASAECSTGLVCSTDVGEPSDDGWHGACQVGSLPDAGATDLNRTTDLGAATD